MNRTIAYAFDFLLETLDYSPDEPGMPSNEVDIRFQPAADPMQKDQYSVIIWNDDKHSFDEVIQLVCDTTNRDRKETTAMAHAIDEHGREVIDMNTNVPRLSEIVQTISKIEIGLTIRRAYDTFREQIVVVIIDWLLDLTRSRLGPDALIIREVIVAQLLSPRPIDEGANRSASHIPDLLNDIPNPCRIDWMFLYHSRLWKKLRISLKEIYASVLTWSHPHRLAICLDLPNDTFSTANATSRESLRRGVPVYRGCVPPCRQGSRNIHQMPDWIRAVRISILKSKPDTVMYSLQFCNGTGEFVFWSAQDSNYPGRQL